MIAKIGVDKEWTGPYKVVTDGSMSVKVSVNDEIRDVSRNRVSKWYDWGDHFKEEAIERPREKIEGEIKPETKEYMTRSKTKSVSFENPFNETNFVMEQNMTNEEFEDLRKREKEKMTSKLAERVSKLGDDEQDQYLSTVYIQEIKQECKEEDEYKEAVKQEKLFLEENNIIGEEVGELEILNMCLEQLGSSEKLNDLEEARDRISNILMTEVSKKEWENPEIKEAICKEIENMKNYGVFGDRIREKSGIEIIGTRLIVTKSQKQDGQKAKFKARCVAQGFKESEKAQSDSPTANRESLRLFLAICTILGFKSLSCLDISGAYLQSEDLKREVYVKLPDEFEPEKNIVYKLKKPLYGLSDAGRQFWLTISKLFKENNYSKLMGDECFYMKRDSQGNLQGVVIIHVDDFIFNGQPEFMENFENMIKSKLNVSKIERGKFRFCGVDYEQLDNGIVASMEDYSESIEEYPTTVLNKLRKETKLTPEQQSCLYGICGQLQWISSICRPDIAYGSHKVSRSCKNGTVGDLKYANSIVRKVKEKPSKVFYKNIGRAEDLIVYVFTDASFTPGEKAPSGHLLLLGSRKSDRIIPILWKTKLIHKACRSSKDAETIALGQAADYGIYTAKQLEEILYGIKDGQKFKTVIFSDSDSSIKSIVSSKQVERRYLRSDVHILKQHLEQGQLEKVVWISDKQQIADILTKDKRDKIGLDEMLRDGRLRIVNSRDYYIFHDGQDYVTIGKALREKIVGKQNITPIKKKLAKTHETIKKINEQIKNESLDESPPKEGQTEKSVDEVFYSDNISARRYHDSSPKAKSAPSSKTASIRKGIPFWRSEAIKIITSLRDRGKRGKSQGKN